MGLKKKKRLEGAWEDDIRGVCRYWLNIQNLRICCQIGALLKCAGEKDVRGGVLRKRGFGEWGGNGIGLDGGR